MKVPALFYWLLILPPFGAATAQVRHIDLRRWGYAPPSRPSNVGGPGEYGGNPHVLSFFSNGDLIVGFVTRVSDYLTTREHSLLTLNALTFTRDGVFRSKQKFQTTDWYDNDLFAGSGSDLLVRTGTDLNLYSPDGKLVVNRKLQDRDAKIQIVPNRRDFAVESSQLHPFQFVFTLLESHTLNLINRCYCTKCWFLSISDHNVLIQPLGYLYPAASRILVAQFCGPLQFRYEWRNEKGEDANQASLIDDNHFVLAGAGSASIEFFNRGVLQWKDYFNRKHDQIDPQVTVDSKGDRFAVLVRTYVGGSKFFDIDGTLKSANIVVYSSASGKRLAEIPVDPPVDYVSSPHIFNFRLSPDGKTLAILLDGDLGIYPINENRSTLTK
ncbi:MAG: hypothetical protein ACRD28_04150 [Acidobacteriaceae bacterium]